MYTESRALFIPQDSNWRKIGELVVYFCTVRSFEEEDFLENSHPVLFCLIKKRSFFKPFVCFWICKQMILCVFSFFITTICTLTS